MYLCPKCKSMMYCVSTLSIPAIITYVCNCGYVSKPIEESLMWEELPENLRNDEDDNE